MESHLKVLPLVQHRMCKDMGPANVHQHDKLGNQTERYMPHPSMLLETGLCMERHWTEVIIHSKALLICLAHHPVSFWKYKLFGCSSCSEPTIFILLKALSSKSLTQLICHSWKMYVTESHSAIFENLWALNTQSPGGSINPAVAALKFLAPIHLAFANVLVLKENLWYLL